MIHPDNRNPLPIDFSKKSMFAKALLVYKEQDIAGIEKLMEENGVFKFDSRSKREKKVENVHQQLRAICGF